MRVFITGGSGLIGIAVVAELLRNGHSVLALARSETSARALVEAGAEPLPGGLVDLEQLRAGARRAEGVVHLAFNHNFSTVEAITSAVAEEREALLAMGSELVGSDRPLVVVSGTPAVPGRPSTEADFLHAAGPLGGRADSVATVLNLSSQRVRSASVRLPRTVHNQGRGGFAGVLTEAARRHGVAGYPPDGSQRWPAVHALDAAALMRLVLERAPAGTTWHAVADEGVPVRDMAEVIGRRLGLAVQAISPESFGPLGWIFATDQPASSRHTQETLGWTPIHPSLLEDLENIGR